MVSRQNGQTGSNGFSCTFGFFFVCPVSLDWASCLVLATSPFDSITCLAVFGSTVIVFSLWLTILSLTLLTFPSSFVPFNLSQTSMVESVSLLKSSVFQMPMCYPLVFLILRRTIYSRVQSYPFVLLCFYSF